MHKLSHRVVFPFELKLVNTTLDCPDPETPFDLFGIVVHMGAQPHHGGMEGETCCMYTLIAVGSGLCLDSRRLLAC